MLALNAKTEERQVIDLGGETIPGANGLTHWLDEVVVHLDRATAAMADQVVVRLIQQFILAGPTAEVRHADQAQLTEQPPQSVRGRWY